MASCGPDGARWLLLRGPGAAVGEALGGGGGYRWRGPSPALPSARALHLGWGGPPATGSHMTSLQRLIEFARDRGASDLHLEPGFPPALRVRGELILGEGAVTGASLVSMAQQVAQGSLWRDFLSQCSLDLSRNIAGVRCRINMFRTARGVAMAIRLLASRTPTLDTLNLHPDLGALVRQPHGLVLVCGPTGSGKSSTIAALVSELNQREARHIITIEQPIEYALRPVRCFIRQREVGRDTPSFEQALVDALREDPDVLVVGEMRMAQTMRRTLDAAETGHLVLTTVHSANVVEAIQRVITAFPAEQQEGVRGQLADCLVAVVAQRLVYKRDLDIRVPECEVLVANAAVRAIVRSGGLHRLPSVLETNADDGMWSWTRYRRWLQGRTRWVRPQQGASQGLPELPPAVPLPGATPPPRAPTRAPRQRTPQTPAAARGDSDGVIDLDSVVGDPRSILSELVGPD